MEKIKLNVKETKETKLPSNLEAEQALIGSVLVNNDIIDEISNIVNSTKFHDPIQEDQACWYSVMHTMAVRS